jgi:predicted RNase H-like HicB family nuclease
VPLAACRIASGRVACGYDGVRFQLLEPNEDCGYVVVCPTFPVCYSQGDTIDEALANSREAIELCLEDMQENGKPILDYSNV